MDDFIVGNTVRVKLGCLYGDESTTSIKLLMEYIDKIADGVIAKIILSVNPSVIVNI